MCDVMLYTSIKQVVMNGPVFDEYTFEDFLEDATPEEWDEASKNVRKDDV